MTSEELDRTLKLLGWRKRHLAEKLGLHENTIYGWGRNGRPIPPTIDTYLALVLEVRKLGKSLSTLVG